MRPDRADDLAQLLILAAERGRRVEEADAKAKGFSSGCYFAADEQQPTYAEFGKMAGKALGQRRTLTIGSPDALIRAVASATWIVSQLRRRPHALSPDKIREATAGDWTCATDLAREQLGFRPGATLAERLKQTADWYLREGWV